MWIRLLRGSLGTSALAALTLAAAARADDAPRSPTLAEVLRDPARLASWLQVQQADVRAAAARLGQARADAAQSRLPPNPTLALNFSDMPLGTTNPPGLPLGQTAIYAAGLSQTVEIGKRGPRAASARLRLDAAQASLKDTLVQAVVEARGALARVVYLKSRRATLEGSLAGVRQVLDLQRQRLDKGDLSGNDYDRLHLDTLTLEEDVEQTRTEYEAALVDCRVALAGPCETDGVDLAALDRLAPLQSVPAEIDQALAGRPDVLAAAAAEGAAHQDALLARRRRIPDPALGLAYTRDWLTISGDQPRTLALSLSLALPLFDRGQHDAARAEQRAQELAETRRASLLRARAEIASLLGRRAYLAAALKRLRDGAVPRSNSVLASTVAALNEGELGMTDLLLARRNDTDLALRLMQLQFDAFSVDNRLRQALGLDAALIDSTAMPRGEAAQENE
jgi:cobalt-zinc-cadmium efflux system outer membrane protein